MKTLYSESINTFRFVMHVFLIAGFGSLMSLLVANFLFEIHIPKWTEALSFSIFLWGVLGLTAHNKYGENNSERL